MENCVVAAAADDGGGELMVAGRDANFNHLFGLILDYERSRGSIPFQVSPAPAFNIQPKQIFEICILQRIEYSCDNVPMCVVYTKLIGFFVAAPSLAVP